MPSMWSLIISTIVFFIAAWYIHRYLDEGAQPVAQTSGDLPQPLKVVGQSQHNRDQVG